MLDTPWVSTPRRSVMVSTSAASAASSGVTPSFSKIWLVVRRSAASETSTWSCGGTLKRSRIMGWLPPGGPHLSAGGRQDKALVDPEAPPGLDSLPGCSGPSNPGPEEADHARSGNGVVTRTDDVPESAVLAAGGRTDPGRSPRAAAAQRPGGDRDPGHHRREHPAYRGRAGYPARAASGLSPGRAHHDRRRSGRSVRRRQQSHVLGLHRRGAPVGPERPGQLRYASGGADQARLPAASRAVPAPAPRAGQARL